MEFIRSLIDLLKPDPIIGGTMTIESESTLIDLDPSQTRQIQTSPDRVEPSNKNVQVSYAGTLALVDGVETGPFYTVSVFGDYGPFLFDTFLRDGGGAKSRYSELVKGFQRGELGVLVYPDSQRAITELPVRIT